jgi:predicted nucleotidyltransferase
LAAWFNQILLSRVLFFLSLQIIKPMSMQDFVEQFASKALGGLKERAKELKCLYEVEELMKDSEKDIREVFKGLLGIIPLGWQYTTVCECRIIYDGEHFMTEDFKETEWMQTAEINIDGNIAGEIQVCYTQFIRLSGDSQFLPEEQKLLNTIAERLSRYIFVQKLRKSVQVLSTADNQAQHPDELKVVLTTDSDEHWKWRFRIAETLASKMDMKDFGAKAIYLIGSSKNANAGPSSDIDLMIHFTGSKNQLERLKAWIEGWSLCLGYFNHLKTGHKVDRLIDLHIITDKDIEKKSSFAVQINGVNERARLLREV